MLHKHALTVYCSETRTHPTRARDWLCVSHTLQASLLEFSPGAKLSRRRLEVPSCLTSPTFRSRDKTVSQARVGKKPRTLTAHSVSPRPLKLGAHQFPLTARCIASSNPKISTQWDLSRPSGSMKLASTINGRPLILSHKPFEAHVSTPSLYSNPKAGHGD